MNYEVTATRKRPRTFDELVGQAFVVATLKSSIRDGRIAHAYLFSGPRGVGKTSAARILAKAINCPDGPDPEGCTEWAGSEEIARGAALDVIEIDGASNTSVNDVRQIKDEVLFAPNSARYKVYIIDEVHMLSTSAFNALLKTIEEPPPYIVFIFATTEIHKVPATIRSRCQQFNFRLIAVEEIRERLSAAAADAGVAAEEDALLWIAREATGSLRDAYTLFDQVVSFSDGHVTLATIQDKLGLVGVDRLTTLVEHLAAGRAAEALAVVEEALAAGVSIERFTTDLADYLRTLLLLRAGVTRESVLGVASTRIPGDLRDAFTREQLELALEIVLQLFRDLRYTVNQRFELELSVSRLAGLAAVVQPAALVARIEALQEEMVHHAAYRAGEEGDRLLSREGPAATDEPAGDGAGDRAATDAAPDPVDGPARAPEASGDGTAEDANGGDALPGAADARYEGLVAGQVEAILAPLRAGQIALASQLARATGWILREGELTVVCPDMFSLNAIKPQRDTILAAARGALGHDALTLRFTVTGEEERTAAGAPGPDPDAEMVKRVFRGEVIREDR